MNRKAIIEFCNSHIFPQVDISAGMTVEDMRDTVKMVSRWRIGKPADIVMNPVVDDGFLIINGDPIGRIAPKMPQPAFSEEAYYWEGKCLAMSEEYD